MIDRDHKLPITRQAKLLKLSRGSVYYLPKPVSEADLALMRRIDELHLKHPFMGTRMLRDQLAGEGIHAGRRHIGTLMGRMGIEALARPATRYQQGGARQQDLSVPAAQAVHRARQPGLGVGHHLHPHGQRLCVPHRRGGCGQSAGPDTQGRHHVGGVSRPRDHRGSLCTIWRAGDRQHRPGQPIHGRGVPTRYWTGAASCRWMAAVRGATMSSSSGSGAARNTSGCTSRSRGSRPPENDLPDRTDRIIQYDNINLEVLMY